MSDDKERERLVMAVEATKTLLHHCKREFEMAENNRLVAFRNFVFAEKSLAEYDARQPRGGEEG